MLSSLGNLLISTSILLSFYLIYCSLKEINSKNIQVLPKLLKLSFLQLLFISLSFVTLLIGYIISDFSLINVYENSHTTKPLFYKISGVWGNHEGSLLLWISILIIFSFFFVYKNRYLEKKFLHLTLFFQNILISGFLIFLLTNSNPFGVIYPTPNEGLGLNPILQDPALAIHPPLLYLGFVGSSIYFSAALASLMSNFTGSNFAYSIKFWVLISWFFQTMGIMVGSIWAYYELGWGGYWFWDPVENSSLMPWFLMTALLHSILILQRKTDIYLWVIILSILTFTMSVTGTFLVRSGVLNSVHTFANDPSRGLYILTFLSFMIFSSLYIFYKYAPKQEKDFTFLSKEFFILINNWFMLFFLVVVLIGTMYPIFLEFFASQKISIGPPYYNIVLAPFLIPFLLFISYGPQSRWMSSKLQNIKGNIIVLIFSLILFFTFFYFTRLENIIVNFVILFAINLIIQTVFDFFKSLKSNSLFSSDISRITSHLGFGLLIFFISINSIFSIEENLNLKVNEKKNVNNYEIFFKDLAVYDEKNYKKVVGDIVVKNNLSNNLEILKPEIRVYNQPETVTYEASIKSKILSDTYVTMSNLSRSEFYNIKFQKKPFMNFIWFSVILISLGGFIRIFIKTNK